MKGIVLFKYVALLLFLGVTFLPVSCRRSSRLRKHQFIPLSEDIQTEDYLQSKLYQLIPKRNYNKSMYLWRRWNPRPIVEVGPGAIKPPISEYPPDQFQGRLRVLLKLSEKMKASKKPLNPDE